MKRSILFLVFLIFAVAISVSFVSVDANAQVQKPILRAPVSGDDTKEVLISSVELPPGFPVPRHTHPGDDYTVVLQGTLELNVEGREPKRVSPREAFYVPTGLVHYTRG